MTPFNHFNFIAPNYDRVIKPVDPSRLYKLTGLPIAGKLLDAGGGTGRISYSLRKWVSDVVIADSSFGMLTQAKNKNCFISVCSNTESLPFADGTFERVIMVDALHHVYDYQVTIDELWRVVKPGGRIVIEEPDITTLPVKVLAIVEKLLLMRSHFISPQKIRNTFMRPNAGINIEKEGATAWIVIDKISEK